MAGNMKVMRVWIEKMRLAMRLVMRSQEALKL